MTIPYQALSVAVTAQQAQDLSVSFVLDTPVQPVFAKIISVYLGGNRVTTARCIITDGVNVSLVIPAAVIAALSEGTETISLVATETTLRTFAVITLTVAAAVGGGDLTSIDSNEDGIVDEAASVDWDGVQNKPSVFTPDTHSHADYISIQASVMEYIATHNSDPIDTLISAGDWRAFVYLKGIGSGWTNATNATLTVPVGKKLVVLRAEPSFIIVDDSANRSSKLINSTDGVDVVTATQTYKGGWLIAGDAATPTKFPEVAAEKTVVASAAGPDGTKRAMGAVFYARLVNA